ncbi:MAG: ribose-phosphate pyrophosphokinase [Deltaproteobacteria bacterium]|nr:ribose-phosphate pyrophosphokinase [Deltaproteobacteria bacterium]
MKIFCLGSNQSISSRIAEALQMSLGSVHVSRFSDGEIFVEFGENVRGADCFLIQTLYPNSSDEIIKLALSADTLKRASAGRVTAVIPYMSYMRQDRKLKPRVPISFKTIANMLVSAGIDRILTMDLHKGQLAGFFDIPVDNLYPHPVVVPYLAEQIADNDFVVVSPDAGGVERARSMLEGLSRYGDLAVIYKFREKKGGVGSYGIVGNVQSKIALVVDDIADTCQTLKQAFNLLVDKGAKKVITFATHGVFSGSAKEILAELPRGTVSVTNTIEISPEIKQLVNVLDVSGLFAEAIKRIHTNASVSELFKW